MSDGAASESSSSPPLPVSAFLGPIAELIQQRMLQPPARPGVMAALDHFEILRLLGGGGMGVVLLARDSQTGNDVAIKMVRSDLVGNPEAVRRFLREAGHLKRLRHSHIVPVSEISDRAEGPYFVMPYYEQGSLANRLQPGQPLDTRTILEIATPVAEGLAFAHRNGIIHRDLKPANLLLGANGGVCLGDFGLARTLFNDTLLEVDNRQFEGTAPYLSPGVAAGNVEDTRCDIYAFGALLYEMLTGQPPYQGQSTREILDKILAAPPKPILSLNPEADRRLVAVAERALARELRDRYAEMRDAVQDLEQIRADRAPGSQSPSASARCWILALAGVTVLAVLSGLGWKFTHPATNPSKPLPPPVVVPVVTPPIRQPPVTAPPAVNPQPTNPIAVSPLAPKLAIFAGQCGVGGYADGLGTNAQFRLPNQVAADRAGNLYVADTGNHVIRKITPEGLVSTLAGQAGSHGSADGTGSDARFWAPFGIAVDAAGNVVVADTANNTIRKITPGGVVSTLAGAAGHPGSADGLGTQAQFRNPWGVAVDHAGNVLVADMSNDAIRKITPTGSVTTLAGQAGESGYLDGLGNRARFDHPFALATDGANNIYVADSANQAIRKLTSAGEVSTLAGLPGYAGTLDGTGTGARFANPQGLVADGAGNLYVADTGNNSVRKITSTGAVTTLAEPSAEHPQPDPKNNLPPLNNPTGVALDAAGNLYIADAHNHCLRQLPLSP